MKVLEEKENFFTKRKEVKVIVEAEKNPSYEEALDVLAKQFNADKELVVVRGVKGKFGRNTFLISAFVYKTKEDKDRFERKPKKKETEEKKAEEKKPEQKPAEEKAEEKKEEQKSEQPQKEEKPA